MFKKASDFLEDELDKLMSYLPASQTPTAETMKQKPLRSVSHFTYRKFCHGTFPNLLSNVLCKKYAIVPRATKNMSH